jgi:thiamine pyrophosphokinase
MTTNLANYFDIQKYRSILCLNGELPDRDFFTGNLPVIAADGAANKLIAMNIQPAIIVGDLDSVDPDILRDHSIYRSTDQNSSDYQKALAYMQQHDLLPTIVTGIAGGALDHILNNVNIFLQTKNIFYAPPTFGFCVQQDESISVATTPGTKISLIGFPQANISTAGLKWELDHYQLHFPGNNSCFNRVSDSNINIKVHQGEILVIIYLEDIVDFGK